MRDLFLGLTPDLVALRVKTCNQYKQPVKFYASSLFSVLSTT